MASVITGQGQPGRRAVLAQLKKMLAHAIFASQRQPSLVLRFIVQEALKGIEVTELHLRVHIFPPPDYELDSNIARRTMGILRELIKDYFKNDGKLDLVLFELPQSLPGKRVKFKPGEAYTPKFRYNPLHEASKEFKLGEVYRRRGDYDDFQHAVRHFSKAIAIHREHYEAFLGLVEVMCDMMQFVDTETKEYLLLLTDDASRFMLDRAPGFWRAHCVRALVLLAKGDIVNAEGEYDVAVSLDRRNAEEFNHIAGFSWKLGKLEEAVGIARNYVTDHIDDPLAYANLAWLLVEQDLDEARLMATQALTMDRNCVDAYVTLAAIEIRCGNVVEAAPHINRMDMMVDKTTSEALTLILRRMSPRRD